MTSKEPQKESSVGSWNEALDMALNNISDGGLGKGPQIGSQMGPQI